MNSSNRRYDLISIVIVFALAMVFEYFGSFSLLEDQTLSYRQILRTLHGDEKYTTPSEDVVIVYTDEAFFAEYGAFPLRRADIARLITKLKDMGAKVIGVDMLLDFNSAYGEDPAVETALKEAGNVVLVSTAKISDGRFMGVNHAIPRFQQYTDSGYSNITSNSAISENIVSLRLYPEVINAGEWPFAVKVVSNYLDEKPSLEGHHLRIGDDIDVKLDHDDAMYIDYPLLPPNGEGATMRLHSVTGLAAGDILFSNDPAELKDLSYLVKDKIVLLGEVAAVAHDEFETPVGDVYGVEVIADEIATLLRSGPLHPASNFLEIIIALIMMLAFIATILIQNPLPRNLVNLAILAVYITLAVLVYIYFGLVLSMSYVLLASLFAIVTINARFYLQERGQKTLIRSAFGQYLSPKVVSELVKNPQKVALGGEEREMTAFFSDIEGFSTFSEQMTPTELVNMLNDYLTEMCNIIIAGEGTVDKFEGDAIIAFWGAPTVQDDHARRACFAAIDMQQAVMSIRDRWTTAGHAPIRVRMGINSGPMVVGNMGSAQRLDYTIMGDAVNLAARLEGANKAYGSGIMISDATYALCRDDVDARELDRIRVVGKSEPVTVYELLARKGQTTGIRADLVSHFAKGRQAYLAGHYDVARDAFKLCTSIDPEDGPSRVFLQRCEAYIKTPPPKDWDGVFSLDEK